MKRYSCLLSWFLLVLGVAFVGCSDDDDEGGRLPMNVFQVSDSVVSVDASEKSVSVIIQTEHNWTLEGNELSWCKVDKRRGIGTDTIHFSIGENVFRDERDCAFVLRGQSGEKTQIQIKQAAALKDYVYRLPVVFHVLYKDADDINQNIDKSFFEDLLPYCTSLYRKGHNGLDIGVEFYMATTDPKGETLPETGIDRVQWNGEFMDAYDFVGSDDSQCVGLLWDPNKYLNVVVYPFPGATKNMSGISTIPFTTSENGLKGLNPGDIYFERSFPHVYCVTLNTQYVIRPNAKQIVAHEFGHYLGLFHVFSSGSKLETDYCADTPNYNRELYMTEAKDIIQKEGEDSPRLYDRKGDDGKVFVSHNVMDYDYTYQDEFTQDQYKRMRHVLENSPLIPGIKKRW